MRQPAAAADKSTSGNNNTVGWSRDTEHSASPSLAEVQCQLIERRFAQFSHFRSEVAAASCHVERLWCVYRRMRVLLALWSLEIERKSRNCCFLTTVELIRRSAAPILDEGTLTLA
ncbi:hypothetical protein C0Q70_07174 [Pomacea canaliculata]|uniref:Uncharacterized protein n=1 Tax=Pomacea canaliculata TaxID=400727 RepID=A0A2T7PEB0_POMCA|nr:hypothetical protein C0Q70_07174 [Pomacea canaliculata]